MISKKLLIHALFWIIFITYEVSVSVYFGDKSSFIQFAAFYILDILLFYFNAHVVFFKFFSNRSFFRYATLAFFILIELVVYCYLSVCLNTLLKTHSFPHIFFYIRAEVLVMSVWRGIYFLGLSVAYWAVSSNIKAIKMSQKTEVDKLISLREKEKLNAEIIRLQNAYLQARINPHFLLNTLNFIYNQVEETSLPAANNILTLSKIMQYSLSTMGDDGKVPLKHEINHIKNYIKLNQSRFNNKLILRTEIIENDSDRRIPPLLILTFVENVFKHGDLTDKETPGAVKIDVTNEELTLFTKNKKRGFADYNKGVLSINVGISNAKTRLKNFYGKDRFKLDISQTETQFTVHLKIML